MRRVHSHGAVLDHDPHAERSFFYFDTSNAAVQHPYAIGRLRRLETGMAGLDKTVAELVARARAVVTDPRRSALEAVTLFGDNPGALRMWVYAPDNLPRSPPMVVVLHGCGQSAAGYVEDSGWLGLADRYGFVVLCPEQGRSNNANLCFTWFDPQDITRGRGEAASIASMVRRASIDHGVDPDRVFVTGLSAGGAMTAVMLATYPELFAAGAIIAGLPYGAAANMPEALSAMRAVPQHSAKVWGDKVRRANPTPRRWPKVAIWHGDADATVAPGAADALVAQWTDVHGVGAGQNAEGLSPRHRLTRWRGADGDILVESHRIKGLGHGAPISASGEDGCGAAAPWVLEAGVSSSLEIAKAWEIVGARRATTAHPPKPAAVRPALARGSLPQTADLNAVISRALRSAGLMG